jgi:threonine dehydratase
VEQAGAPKLTQARAAGRPVKLEQTSSIADGLLAVEIGHLTFAHHERHLDEVVLVEDEAMKRAMRQLLDRAKLVAEPSGAITAAAVMEGAVTWTAPTVVVLSGGNIEWDGLRQIMG